MVLGIIGTEPPHRLLELCIYNTADELFEAQRTSHINRIARSPMGTKIQQRLARTIEFEHPFVEHVPVFLQAVI